MSILLFILFVGSVCSCYRLHSTIPPIQSQPQFRFLSIRVFPHHAPELTARTVGYYCTSSPSTSHCCCALYAALRVPCGDLYSV
ncbi:hypothetical protein DFH11DRAFT_1587284 [Phellopilus nigrolimitatus]|nr:hypothetical protein DFH11DRAFT_1587284 [Phellopilus nigrolimitatus]